MNILKYKYLCINPQWVLCVLFQCLALSIFAQSNTNTNLTFTHLTIDDGLSSNRVQVVVQDLDGYTWIGTNNGLNRYNGYEFKTYLFEPNNKYSISGNEVQTLYVDKKGVLWIGTNGRGFCYYDKAQDRFMRMPYFESCEIMDFIEDSHDNLWVFGASCIGKLHQKTKKIELISDDTGNMPSIRKVIQSNESDIFWVGTANNGLYTFNIKNRQLNPFRDTKGSFSDINIESLHLDRYKVLWIGYNKNGKIDCFDTQSKTIKPITHQNNTPNSIPDFPVTCFMEEDNQMWIGTRNGGLCIFDRKTQKYITYSYQKNMKNGLNSNSISVEGGLYKDKQGRIWIPTAFGGVNIVDKHKAKFTSISESLPNPTVNAILKDTKQRLWIGTENGIIKREIDGKEKVYLDCPILSIKEDDSGRIWIGTWEQGVQLYNEKEDKFIQFLQEQTSRNSMFGMIPQKSYIWLTTPVGLSKMYYDKLGHFENYSFECESGFIQNGFIFKNRIWVASSIGLKIFDTQTNKTVCLTHNPNDTQSLSSSFVSSIFYDSKERYWIGTKEGLNLKTGEETFKRITKADGLPSEAINSMLEDNKGYLWIATNKGLSKYDTEKEIFRNYDVSDGLQSNEFRQNACFKDKDGFLYFGGVNGLNIFHPDSIRDNPHIPQVHISGLKIFNRTILIGDTSKVLTQNISLTKSLTFDYTQSVFTLEFVALNYAHPEKNQYAYKLEGFDKDWVYVGNKREATYTNLDAGTYIFRVKASNNDGLWNEKGTSITIIILPPWWETWWFRTCVAILVIGGAVSFYLIRINAVKKQNKKLEKTVIERTEEIYHQKEEILTQNEELRQSQEELMAQREFIERQNQALQDQHKHIKASIQSGLIIQKSFLPFDSRITQYFKDYFIFYQPKDVVSGDFYWIERLADKVIVVVADCTGHGVPGAFMSLIGINLLEKIVIQNNITSPASILTKLHLLVREALNQEESGNNNGMDIAIAVLETTDAGKTQITYSGAKRPLYYIDSLSPDTVGKLEETRKSIGGIQNESVHFKQHTIILPTDSMVYMSTDGYTDQNNAKRKRLGDKIFFEMLYQNNQSGCEEQKTVLRQTLKLHMQDTEQRDDVLVLGVRV